MSLALDLSVACFVVYGAMYLVIGALAPVMHRREPWGSTILILSPRTDAVLLGKPVAELLRASPALAPLRTALITWLGGALATIGVFEMAVAWFGLRAGQPWAFWTLLGADLVMVPFWVLFFAPYVRAGARPRLRDLQPVLVVPSVALVPAAILGYVALYA